MPKKRMVSIRVKPRLWQAAKVKAYTEGKTLEEWLEGAIRTRLSNSGKSPKSGSMWRQSPNSRGMV